jgi:fructokinase
LRRVDQDISGLYEGSVAEIGAAEALAMIEDARGSTTISFDPNCRPNLVRHKARYVDQMNAFAAAANIVLISDVDFEFLYGGSD